MGLVIKETVKGSVFQYLGVLLGGLNVALLFPHFLGDENWGVLSIIVSTVTIFSQLSSLGGGSVVLKYYPKFNTNISKKGFISFTFKLTLFGLLLFSCILLISKNYFFSNELAYVNSSIEILTLVISLLFFNTILNLLQSYISINLKTSVSIFLKDFLLRLLQTLFVFAFIWFDLTFTTFLILYVCSYLIVTYIGFYYLLSKRIIMLNQVVASSKEINKKEYIIYGLYTIVAGFGSAFAGNIDVIMIGTLLQNGDILAGKYKTAIYLTALIAMPLRPLYQIMYSLLSSWWKESKTQEIDSMYKQSTKIGLLVSGSLLTYLLINISWLSGLIFTNLTDVFYIILFCGIGQLINAATGVNGTIINLSKYYQFSAYSILVLVIINLALNYIFIPKYSIEGAALATGISLTLFNLAKLVYVKVKLKLNGHNRDFFILLTLICICLIITVNMYQGNYLNLVNSIITSTIFTLIIFGYLYFSGTISKIKAAIKK